MTATTMQQLITLLSALALCAVCIVAYAKYPLVRPLAAMWLTVGVNVSALYIVAFFLFDDSISAEWTIAWSVSTRVHAITVAAWSVLARVYELQ